MTDQVKKLLKDERGDIAHLRTLFTMLCLMVMLSGLLWFTTLMIQVWDLRTTMQQCLDNAVVEAVSETYQGMREDSLEEYDKDLDALLGTAAERYIKIAFAMRMNEASYTNNGSIAFVGDNQFWGYVLLDELEFVHKESCIVVYARSTLQAPYPTMLFTGSQGFFEVPIEVSATINTKFDS